MACTIRNERQTTKMSDPQIQKLQKSSTDGRLDKDINEKTGKTPGTNNMPVSQGRVGAHKV